MRSGLRPRLDERVGAAVDPDEHRAVLADVGAQRAQVLLVVVAAHDDEGVPAVELGGDVGDADAVEQQLALAAQVLHRVGGERLELDGQPGPRLGHRGLHQLGVEACALGDDLVADPDLVAVDRGPAAPR